MVNPLKHIQISSLLVLIGVLLGSFLLAAFSYRVLITTQDAHITTANATAVATVPPVNPTSTGGAGSGSGISQYPSVVSPASILGIVADTQTAFTDIPWVRLGYNTCIANN